MGVRAYACVRACVSACVWVLMRVYVCVHEVVGDQEAWIVNNIIEYQALAQRYTRQTGIRTII